MAEERNLNPRDIGFWALVREDLHAHGGHFTSPGFRAIFVHRFGNWRMDIKAKPLRAPFSVLYRWLFRRMRTLYGIEVEYCTRLGRRVVIDHQSGIVINGYCEIGDDCRLRQNVTMGIKTLDDPDGAPKLGRNVDVGAGAVILGRISIGDDAQIGANAVVLKDIPAGALAVGVPARIIERVAVR